MYIMRKTLFLIFNAIAALFISHTMTAQTPDFKTPDFAYPKTVEADAKAMLEKASGLKGDAAAATRLRAVLELCAAQTQIDRNSAFAQPALIAKQAAASEGAGRAMLLTLEAAKYAQIYSNNSWKYDRVDTPLEPFPADVSEWSGKQFQARIAELLDEAMQIAAPTPLAVFEASLEYSPEALQYMLTTADFIRYKAFCVLNSSGGSEKARAVADEAMKAADKTSPVYFFWCAVRYTNDSNILTDIYKQNSGIEAARLLLQRIVDNPVSYLYEEENGTDSEKRTIAIRDRKIAMIRESLAKFPAWYGNNDLKNSLARLTQPRVSYSYPSMAAPGSDIKISCSYSFAKNIEAALYTLPANAQNIDVNSLLKRSKAVSASYAPSGTDGKTELTLKAPAAGEYALIVTIDGKPGNSGWSVPEILVTPLIGFSLNGCKENAVVAVDYTTGMPLAGVTIKSETNSNRRNQGRTSALVGKTGSDGFLLTDALPSGSNNRHYTFTYQGRTYDFDNNVRMMAFYDGRPSEERFDVKLMTDRALYHPGDSVQWAVAVARLGVEKGAVPVAAADMKLTVELRDANGQPVASSAVATDRFGRAYGSFPTKEGALTGSYTFRIKEISSFYGRVMVSDFKMPTFEAKIDKIERDVPATGDVRITGSARTFTGMAVAGAKVDLTLTGARRWRWFSPDTELADFNTTTGADGTFSVDIPASAFKSTDEVFTDFIIEADITSATAETAKASRNFTIGKPYSLAMSRTPRCADTSAPVEALFEAYNADNEQADIAVRWSLGASDGDSLKSVVASGSAVTGHTVKLDLQSVPAGVYTFRIEAADSALAAPAMASEIILYNEAKNRVPETGSPVFIPSDMYRPDGRKAKILAGVAGSDKVCAFIAVRSGETLVSFRKEMLKPGFSHINIDMPTGSDRLQVLVTSVRNGQVYTEDITIARPEPAPVKVVAESFRNKLTPGLGETWRFRLTDGDGKALDATMVATIYNKALDKIYNGTWPGSFMTAGKPGWLDVSAPGTGRYSRYVNGDITLLDVISIEYPDFRFFNPYTLLNGTVTGFAVKRSMNTLASSSATAGGAMMRTEASAEYADDMEFEEEIAAPADGTAADTGADESPEEFDYRAAELLQVLWQPALVADADGNIDIVFTMPNAIGSWQFKAFAWTPELKAAAYAAECMSTKPVMVQANLPRFLRQGDKARVLATVYNNSDDDAAVTTTVELFDLASGKTTRTAVSTDSIAKGASAIVAIDIDVPTDASAIGYRVRSACGGYSDGEQSAIPVLASSATVIESTEFYLNPKETKPFEFTVPAAGDASVTLQYCQNPVWTVVKAMRGLSEPGNTSNRIVGSLFSALAGKHITDKDANIASAIAEWKANPGEEALVSMLAKNEELKKLLLDQTPWVQTSKDQSARMSSLSDLLDPETTAKAIAKRTEDLAKLQNADGGFAWGPWSDGSSVWATETVLTTLGLANSLGMLPADAKIAGMLQPAFEYLQAEAVKPKRPKTDRDLALIAALLPDLKVKPAADNILRATVADIAKNWRKDNTVGKAYDILIFKANGREALAKDVLASVAQHGVVQQGKGLCFPNVNDVRGYATIIQAYAAMSAPADDIDAMRQWITVYAQANDDLGAYNPDYIIASVLMTGSDWTSVPVKENVTVNGRPLEIGKIESATGYFAQTLVADGSKPLVITVQPNGVTPSYGSVVSVGRRPMAGIEAKAGSDVSVEKRVLVQRGGEWIETNAFALGERVRVQLVIKAKRDVQYVTVDDERPAAFEPVDQLPGYIYDGGLGFYRENGDAATRLFIGFLPKGTYHVAYDMTAAVEGSFISGIATLQSQYAPEITAHSGAAAITVSSAE